MNSYEIFLFQVKTHLQALADKQIAVGHQHKHSGMLRAFHSIVSLEGVRGLWRGATAAVARVSVGSAAQLSTFSKCKDIVEHSQVWKCAACKCHAVQYVCKYCNNIIYNNCTILLSAKQCVTVS